MIDMPKQLRALGFLDLAFIDWDKCPKWVRDAKKDMRKKYGDPCKLYAPNCPVCTAWTHFAELALFFERT